VTVLWFEGMLYLANQSVGFGSLLVRERTMLRQFILTSLLGLALLFSQGGVLVVAALCPHLSLATPICDVSNGQPAMDHAHMAEPDVDRRLPLEEDVSHAIDVGAVLGQPGEPCSHCAVHSRTNPSPASLRQSDVAKRSVDFNIQLHPPRIGPVTVSLVPVLISRAHGPPGDLTSRHILISIFRI
jgi:hypothetical protein